MGRFATLTLEEKPKTGRFAHLVRSQGGVATKPLPATDYGATAPKPQTVTPKKPTSQFDPEYLNQMASMGFSAGGQEPVRQSIGQASKPAITPGITEENIAFANKPRKAITVNVPEYLKETGLFTPEAYKMYGKGLAERADKRTKYTGKGFKQSLDMGVWSAKELGDFLTLGRFTDKSFEKKQKEKAEEFAGWSGMAIPTLENLVESTVSFYLFGKAFRGLTYLGSKISAVPAIAKATSAIEKAGGISKVAKRFPRIVINAKKVAGAFAKGGTIGSLKEYGKHLGKEPLSQTFKRAGITGAQYGAFASVFEGAAIADKAMYVKSLRHSMIKAKQAQISRAFQKRELEIRQFVNKAKFPPEVTDESAAKSLLLQQRLRGMGTNQRYETQKGLREIDTIVTSVEQRLLNYKKGDIFESTQSLDSPAKAAEYYMKYGHLPKSITKIRVAPELKKGLGEPSQKGNIRWQKNLEKALKRLESRDPRQREIGKAQIELLKKQKPSIEVHVSEDVIPKTNVISKTIEAVKHPLETTQKGLARQGVISYKPTGEVMPAKPTNIPPTFVKQAAKPEKETTIAPQQQKGLEAKPKAAKELVPAPMGHIKAEKNMSGKYEIKMGTKAPDNPFNNEFFTGEFATAQIARKSYEAWFLQQQQIKIPPAKDHISQVGKEVEAEGKIAEAINITRAAIKVPGGIETIPRPGIETGGALYIAHPSTRTKDAFDVSIILHDSVTGKDVAARHIEFEEKEGALEYLKNVHKRNVKVAIEQNKPVPLEVLQEYSGEKWAEEAIAKTEKTSPEKKAAKISKIIYTSTPAEWRQQEKLTDWGKKGLRVPGNFKVGKRKTFIWDDEYERIPTRLPKATMDAIKKKAGNDFFSVSNFKKGEENYYLAPKKIVQALKTELGENAFERSPKPVRTPKQLINDAINSMKTRGDIPPAEMGEAVLEMARDFGLTEDDLSDIQKSYVKEFYDEKAYRTVPKDIQKGVEQEVPATDIEAQERIAIQEEHIAEEVGDFLDGLVDKKAPIDKRPTDLIGQKVPLPKIIGKQKEFLDKDDYKTAKPDIEGQGTFESKEAGEKKIETGVGAARFSFTSLNPAIKRAQKLAKANNQDYYVVQQTGGRFVSRISKPKKGYYTTVNPSGEATFIKQASLTAEESFDYGEHLKKREIFVDKLEEFKSKLQKKTANVKALQNELFNMTKASGMSPAKVKAVLGLLRNIRPDRLEKSNVKTLLKAIARASEYIEQGNNRLLTSAILKKLNKAKAKKVGGILKGKLTPETQKRLNYIRESIKQGVTRSRVLEKMALNMEKMQKGDMLPVEMLEANSMLNLTGLKGSTSKEKLEILNGIELLRTQGKLVHDAKIAEIKERRAKIKTRVLNILTGGKGLKEGTGSLPSEAVEKKPFFINKVNRWSSSWDNLMDYLSRFDKNSKPYESDISKLGDLAHISEHNEAAGAEKYTAKTHNAFVDVFGVKTNPQMWEKMDKLQKKNITLGTFTNAIGEKVNWKKLSKEQLIKMYMAMQDSTLNETFTGGATEEGEKYGMHWTSEMRNAVLNNLTPQEKAWGNKHLELYKEYRPSINKVHKDQFFVDMPVIDKYSPINRMAEQERPEESLLFKEVIRHKSTTNPSLKARVKSVIPLEWVEADKTLMNHIIRMEHFKSWAKTINELRSIFGDKEIRQAIRQYHGKHILSRIDMELDQFAKGGIDQMLIHNWIDKVRRNFTVAALAKPAIAPKQIPSSLAYLFEMPLSDYIKGVSLFWLRPIKHTQLLKELSPIFKETLKSGYERDVKLAKQKGYAKIITSKRSFADWAMAHIKAFDYIARGPGQYAKWLSEMKRNKLGKEAAMRAAERTTGRTQPGWKLSQLSAPQKGGSLWKLFTMFQTQPIRYYSVAVDNARNFVYGRGSRTKALSNLAIVWVLLPMLFNWIADAFQWKPKHQAVAVALGPFSYIPVAGKLIANIALALVGEAYGTQLSPVQSIPEKVKRTATSLRKLFKSNKRVDESTNEDAIKVIEGLAEVSGYITGTPTPYAVQLEKASRKIKAGEKDEKRIGWRQSPYAEFLFSPYALKAPKTGKISEKILHKKTKTKRKRVL